MKYKLNDKFFEKNKIYVVERESLIYKNKDNEIELKTIYTEDYLIRLWSVLVRRKYKNRCDICGRRGTEAHHMYDKSTYPEKRYDVENGVALCKYHHKQFHHDFMGGAMYSCTYKDYKRYKELLDEYKLSLTTARLFLSVDWDYVLDKLDDDNENYKKINALKNMM